MRRISLWMMLLVLLLTPSMVLAERTAPKGTVTPRRGPYAGKVCKYGDGSATYTRVSEFTVAELESFISGKKEPPAGHLVDVDQFLFAIKERDYLHGSQLAKEGYDRYKELVLACLEDGEVNVKAETCRHKAPLPIGISIRTGKAVAEYEMMINHLGYWLIEPGWVRYIKAKD